ncbi:surface-adhesin E family protein [Ramlibacter sp. Leaf400]|uniref:surface-adhesin E family protein n=1 Tax=Ramlibacter sp. Leaf400 TaxID=1736365 RepID=UPI0006FE155A|nr:surface-adhesin E family protein [Ramlibacter sp. Leaf400]KQT14342.1 hypothetical protein ASG30_01830 [Ramlibacter sp. Leaf400]
MRLRALLHAAALAVAASALPAQADDWVSYGQSENGSYYFDRATLRTDGDRKRVWRLFALKAPRGDGVQSGKALIEFNCKAETFRYLRTMYYSGPMGQGRYVGGAKEQSTEPVGPGTMIGELARRVC